MNILIVGKDSYIGNHLDEWLTKYGHEVNQLDLLTEDWQHYDYSKYDAIIHVAGIVHRPDCKDWNLYKRVNAYIPIELASLAKAQGVNTYVFFSTMGVYGEGKALNGNVIDESTELKSDSMYSKSKLLAEQGLTKLSDDNFRVAFVRPPSVYGKGCKGGYITGFTRIVSMLPVIPKAYVDARQSFIYIDNLCECVRLIVENGLSGAFCPQDDEIPNANDLFKAISAGIGKKYRESIILGYLMTIVSFIPLIKKAYGGISYSRSLSYMEGNDYVVVPFREGMRRTVSQ